MMKKRKCGDMAKMMRAIGGRMPGGFPGGFPGGGMPPGGFGL
jgi:signal recognition particle subunit SRP54